MVEGVGVVVRLRPRVGLVARVPAAAAPAAGVVEEDGVAVRGEAGCEGGEELFFEAGELGGLLLAFLFDCLEVGAVVVVALTPWLMMTQGDFCSGFTAAAAAAAG